MLQSSSDVKFTVCNNIITILEPQAALTNKKQMESNHEHLRQFPLSMTDEIDMVNEI